MRVHRLVADGKHRHWKELNLSRFGMRGNSVALARKPFEIAAVLCVVRVFIHPSKRALRKRQRFWIAGGLICRGQTVQAKTHSIEMLSIGVVRRGLTFIAEAPVESAVLFIPHYVADEVHALVSDRQKLLLEFGPSHSHL